MIIDNEYINIDDLVNSKYMHKKINDNIYLSEYQISILNMYKIDPYTCNNIDYLLYLIDEVLQDEYIEELDNISKEISEFNYYANTNK